MSLYPRRSWRRGIAGFGAGRGLGVSFPQVMVPVPQPGGAVTEMPTAETSLANAAAQYINDPYQFTVANNTPEYTSPAAFSANMVYFAQTLCMNSWAPYTCVGFDPGTMGQKYANIVFAALRAKILPSTGLSVYDTWVSKPPTLPPDYTLPILPAPYNPASVPGSSALPPPPASYTPPPQPVAGPVPGSPAWYAANPGAALAPAGGSSVSSSGSSSTSSNTSNTGGAAVAVPNWPLIAGGAALVLGGLYFLGGSR